MNKKRLVRKTHRYLGLFIGLQFLAWTLSGLYFSWNNLNSVHGDQFKADVGGLSYSLDMKSPSSALQHLRSIDPDLRLNGLKLIDLLGRPTYQIDVLMLGSSSLSSDSLPSRHQQFLLVDAINGTIRPPLSKQESQKLAVGRIAAPATIDEATLITEVDGHHEYRGRPLPVWQVTFREPNVTAYVQPDMGSFMTVRHTQWRIFDFLWMFHTMDYAGRDDFNNWLLKIFSVFGLLAVISGGCLFVVSRPNKARH